MRKNNFKSSGLLKFIQTTSILIIIFYFSLLIPTSTVSQTELLGNLPPVSNPKLDEKKHNVFNKVDVMEEVFFVGKDSYDPNPEDNLTYHWDFGDGTWSNEVSPVHIYKRVGVYSVSLEVNDSRSSDTSIISIVVISEGHNKPVSILKSSAHKDEFGNNFAEKEINIFFNATESYDPDGFPLSYDWNFGDGNKETGDMVIHKYTTDGTFTVTLTVNDNDQLTSSSTIEIKVGTGEKSNTDENNDTDDGALTMGYLISGLVVIFVIILVVIWLYLMNAKKRTMKQVKISSLGITQTRPTNITTPPRKPPVPEFGKPRTQERDKAIRQARVERLASHQKTIKKDILRQRLASERKKLDSDMKKELEEMGIDL